MWRREVPMTLQVGRDRLALWRGEVGRLALVTEEALPTPEDGPPDAAALAQCLAALWPRVTEGETAWAKRPTALTAVIESAWMPVALLRVGADLWRAGELEALARHRFHEVHGVVSAAWQLRVDHLAGDAHGMAFGLAPEVLGTLQSSCADVRLSLASVQPAWAWAFNHAARSLRTAPATGPVWWMWPEQDRSLLARLERGCIVGLHPALPAQMTASEMRQAAQAEARRQGALHRVPGVMVAGTWQMPSLDIVASASASASASVNANANAKSLSDADANVSVSIEWLALTSGSTA